MAAKVSYFKIGVFVLTTAFLILAGMVILGAGSLFEKSFVILTYMPEPVGALTVGAPIKINGVTIGKVSNIELSGARYKPAIDEKDLARYQRHLMMVVVSMKITESRPGAQLAGRSFAERKNALDRMAGEGWRVCLQSGGIAGQPFLSLVESKSPPMDLSDVPWQKEREDELYLPSTPSMKEKLTSAVESLADNLSGADFAGALKRGDELLTSLQPLVAKLEGVAAGLTDLSSEVKKSLREDVPGITSQVNNITKNLDTLIVAVQKLSQDDVKPTMTDIRTAASELKNVVSGVDSMRRDVNLRMPAYLDRLNVILANLDQASASLRNLSEQAEQYPSRTIFGPAPSDPVIPKEKKK
jgi:phospholipid/cholesterol/gamma-HCH transport system substrate-binding protein